MKEEQKPIVTDYWWTGKSNFGDVMSPLLLRHFADLKVEWTHPMLAQVTCTGSVLDSLPQQGWDGIVAGSGKLHEGTETDLRAATVLGLRGHLTRQHVKLHNHTGVVIGDPGLLASELIPVERGKYDIGVVPHWTDTELYAKEEHNARRYQYGTTHFIDTTLPPLEVIRDIGSCNRIVTSSLHGVIVADSFGIPRRVEMSPKVLSSPHEGGYFKFLDYASALEQEITFGKLQWAPPERVEIIQYELFDMLKELGRMLREA